ncbi:MAG TPA: phosphatase PAP2 family protein [Actinomycetota bacterium]
MPRDLGDVAERRAVKVGGIQISGRRRRPSGEPAPLPHELKASGWFWLGVGIFLFGLWISIFAWSTTTDWWTARDLTVLNRLADLRTPTQTTIARALNALGSFWTVRLLRWSTIVTLVVFKRWRALFGVLAAIVIVDTTAETLTTVIGRPRPLVTQIGDWVGYAHPSVPVAALAVSLVVIGSALIPKGAWRVRWFWLVAVAIVALAWARMYLGVDHPTDVATGALLGGSVAVLVFRLFVPDSVFPVSYGRGRTAHLDVSGARGDAIVRGLREQLGIEVQEIKPYGLEGSGGSTPLRLTVSGGTDRYLFAKLYARSHLRADRWYKLGRTILYGALEDEVRFVSVRQLVEREDYLLLVMQKAGVPSAEPHGIVELTPEREYLIVTEFFDGAREIGEAEISDEVIDSALGVVRALWDTGLAHRDIKPANLLAQDHRVVLIDVAGATVRPSPWRQAVDLANLMIILGLRVDPEHVYELATRRFSPDDIAEAFAATRGVTIPSQSRKWLKRRAADGTDVVARFRELAPDREPISIQRWSARRLSLTLAAVGLAGLFGAFLVANILGRGIV